MALIPPALVRIESPRGAGEPRRVRVYLEMARGEHPGLAAHVPAAPGLIAFGRDERRALQDLSQAARLYARTLARHHFEPAFSGGRRAWRVAARLAGQPFWRSGHAAALLPTDRAAPSDGRIRRVLRIVRAFRREHLDHLEALGDRAYRRRPGPGRRSPRETLHHLANCEWWYCSRLNDRLPEPGRGCPRETRARLAHLLEFAQSYLISLPPAARSRVVTPRRFASPGGREVWTAGKVLRRLAEHEFEHLRAALGWRPMRT